MARSIWKHEARQATIYRADGPDVSLNEATKIVISSAMWNLARHLSSGSRCLGVWADDLSVESVDGRETLKLSISAEVDTIDAVVPLD